jgi:hypothetical protein
MTPVKPGEYGRSGNGFGSAGADAGASGLEDVAVSVLLVVIVALLGADLSSG